MKALGEDVRRKTIELLESLIGIRSANPPGDEDRIADAVETLLRETGLEPVRVRLSEHRSSVVTRVKGRQPGALVLCGHLDTVNTDPDQWPSDPWAAKRVGNRIYGLGAADMKGGVSVLISLVRELVRRDVEPSHDLVLVLTADEEQGYRGAAGVAEAGLIDDARFLLIAEPTAGNVYLGQKGELWVECTFSGRAAHGSIPDSASARSSRQRSFASTLHSRGVRSRRSRDAVGRH